MHLEIETFNVFAYIYPLLVDKDLHECQNLNLHEFLLYAFYSESSLFFDEIYSLYS